MFPRTPKAWLVAAGCLFTVLHAAPDAGSVLRENERTRRELPPATPPATGLPSVTGGGSTRPSGTASKDVTVQVDRILIPEGYNVTQEDVDEALAGRLGKRLNFTQIFDCLDIVADLLKKRGYPFARVFLPEQRMSGAEIRVRVYTGVVDGVEAVPNAKEPRLAPADVAARVASAMPQGKCFYTPSAERGLLIAADFVGRPVSGQLSPGRDVGTTKLTVFYDEAPATSWQVLADNYGNKYTGRERLSADGRVAIGAIAGDAVSFGLSRSTDLSNWHVGYQTPVGPSGWTAGLAYSDIHYALSGAFAGFEGDARELRLTTSYPLVRTRDHSLYLDIGFSSRDLSTVNGAYTLPRKVGAGSVGLRTESYDDVLGGGVTSADATLTVGKATVDSAVDPANFRGATGGYSKLLVNVSRLQRVSETSTLTGALRIQLTNDNLDTSEQGSLGGPYGLRAYANEEGTGDAFAILSLDLQKQVTEDWSFKAFADYGDVSITKNVYSGFTGRQNYSLGDVGIGAEWTGRLLGATAVLSINLATAVGNNPGLNAQGLDSEGSTSKTRLWIALSTRF